MTDRMETLAGGREGLIFRSGEKVFRPCGGWSEAVHQLLTHLERVGFNSAPKSFGFDEQGREVLSYVDGEVYNYPLTGHVASDGALISAAKLLRDYHDATAAFIASPSFADLQWMLPSRAPQQVICHGDYAPYNVALVGCEVVGMFDFDTAHPAPRIWDLAYAVYCWAPFKTHAADALGNLTEQSKRARLFCDGYGLSVADRHGLVASMIERIQTLVDFMQGEASKGNQAFIENLEQGHHLAYLADIAYLQTNHAVITRALLSEDSTI